MESTGTETAGFCPSAFSLGALGGDPRTIADPFQWNQMGMTRGVPSNHR
ncbi:MAG: hypothetical protein AVDCRST_MAG61-879 [uncultured Friedmanniella sp.]|uniref:Uncharacterized protein n=1 Tax=uncultured Friedmanniella sp. TaxID=335381 RepID=A0A6J4KA09_9ACTN|nr:MAG: hypothetical protein AVDCRST_MAG61-879 [uncultured Friedmanniella sp.]